MTGLASRAGHAVSACAVFLAGYVAWEFSAVSGRVLGGEALRDRAAAEEARRFSAAIVDAYDALRETGRLQGGLFGSDISSELVTFIGAGGTVSAAVDLLRAAGFAVVIGSEPVVSGDVATARQVVYASSDMLFASVLPKDRCAHSADIRRSSGHCAGRRHAGSDHGVEPLTWLG